VRSALYAIAGMYNQGPISLTVAYENLFLKDASGNLLCSIANGATACAAAGGLDNISGGAIGAAIRATYGLAGDHIDVWTAGGSYDFGVAKVMAAYTYLEGYQHGWQVGTRAPVGAATLKLGYSISNSTNLSAGTGAAAGTVVTSNGQCGKVAAGVDYDMSKRTRLYADVAHLTQDDAGGACSGGLTTNGGSYASSGGGRDNGSGYGKTGVNVGIRHSF